MPSDASPVPLRVAVVDSGIQPLHPHVGGAVEGLALVGRPDDWRDRHGHGTAVAAAIREKAPAATLVAVKVFDGALAVGINTLVRAIDAAVDLGCHLINLSLGTTRLEHAARLHAAVERARARGSVIVAARTDGQQQFLPGSLPGVVGVVVDWSLLRERVRALRLATGQIVCHAAGYPRPVDGVPQERNLKGVSFAVANTTGWLAGEASRGGTVDSALERLLAVERTTRDPVGSRVAW